MNQTGIDSAIHEAKQALSAAQASEQSCREAFLASVLVTQAKQTELTQVLALVADNTPPEELPSVPRWSVTKHATGRLLRCRA